MASGVGAGRRWVWTMGLREKWPLSRRAHLLGSLVPVRHWYRLALLMGRTHAAVTGGRGGLAPKVQSWIMSEHWMIALTSRHEFAVPYRCEGIDPCEAYDGNGGRSKRGTVICSMHTPYLGIVPRALLERGCKVDAVVADPGNIRPDGQYLPLGCRSGPPAIAADKGSLFRARTVLRAGGLIAATLDSQMGGALLPAVLQFATRVGARVVLVWTEMDPDDVIRITYAEPAWPVLDTPEKIAATLDRMRAERARIVMAMGAPPESLDKSDPA